MPAVEEFLKVSLVSTSVLNQMNNKNVYSAPTSYLTKQPLHMVPISCSVLEIDF